MNRALAKLSLVVGALILAACAITDPSPYAHGLLQPAFNHAWNNAIDAMKDEGVQVVEADLAAGRLEGRRGGVKVTGKVVTQSIGQVRVSFAASGALAEDPDLAQRVQQRYEARMAH